jgi:hypothetical protein
MVCLDLQDFKTPVLPRSVQDLTDIILTGLDQITFISLQPTLTVFNDQEACLLLVSIEYMWRNNSVEWPQIWVPLGRLDFRDELRLWLRSVDCDLDKINDKYVISNALSPLHLQLETLDLNKKFEQASFDILTKFSKLTRAAKSQTALAIKHPLARPFLAVLPQNVRKVFLTSSEIKELLSDYDAAEKYLEHFASELVGKFVEKPKYTNKFDYDQLTNFRGYFIGQCCTIEDLTLPNHLLNAKVFCGGVEPGLRATVWPILLNIHDKQMPDKFQSDSKYNSLKDEIAYILSDPNHEKFQQISDSKYRIEKDVPRTEFGQHENMSTALENVLMAFSLYNVDVGYVQGMNDLAAPIIQVCNDEADAFWCLEKFMSKFTLRNFSETQLGIKQQLTSISLLLKVIDYEMYLHLGHIDSLHMFSCFRWILVWFKREFPFDQIKQLWEIIWACPFTVNFHLFVTVAIINLNRLEIFNLTAFDQLLKVLNILI